MASGTVLVTGASTGIGEATVVHLKELGFDAVGAVRKDEDAERLEARSGGEDSPAATNATPAGRFENRRTELVILER